MAETQIPLNISIAPFPEGFEGDMDETFQQAIQLMEAWIEGNFLTGLILPPGSTLPNTDVGPIAMGGIWYFWDPATGQYLPQTQSAKVAKNFVKNPVYQVQQTGPTFTLGAGATQAYDLVQARSTAANVLAIAPDTGPGASAEYDYISSSIKYTVGPVLATSPGVSDLYAHEHLIEGSDLAAIRGQIMTLSFLVYVNQAGTYSVYLTSSGRDASFVANFQAVNANTWYRVKITGIPALPTSTGTWNFGEGQTGLYIGVALCIGSQWKTTTPNTWSAGFFAGTTQNANLCTVVNNFIRITGLKLEASPSATYLSVPPFEADYGEATRYYFTTFNYQSTTVGAALVLQSQSTNNAFGSMLFNRRMCKTPTVVPYGWSSHAAGNVTNLSTGADVATPTLPATPKATGGSIATTSTKGDTFACIVVADARLS